MGSVGSRLRRLLMTDLPRIQHFACGCRPHISFCGILDMLSTQVEMLEITAEDELRPLCRACIEVWNGPGCGACPCSSSDICEACAD